MERCAVFALLLLGSGALMGVAMGNVALVLLLITFILDSVRTPSGLARSPFVWLTVAYLAFLILQLALGPLRPAVPMVMQLDGFKNHIDVGYLAALVVGYWLYRKPEWQFTVFMLVPAGLLVRVFERWEPGAFTRALNGKDRFTFGDTAVDFGLWSLVAAVFALVLVRGAWRLRSRPWRVAALVYLVSVLVLALIGVLLSQTRSVWLIAPVALVLASALGSAAIIPRRFWGRVVSAAAVVLVVLGVTLYWGFGELIAARWGKGQEALGVLAEGEWQSLGDGSIGLRAKMAYEGVMRWLEHPFLGHGFGSAAELLAHSRFEGVVSRGFTHFHNTAITIMVEHGIAGLALFLALFVFCVVSLVRALPGDVTGVASAALVGLLAMAWQSLADHVIAGPRDPFMIALLGGVAVSCHLSRLNTAPVRNPLSARDGMEPNGTHQAGCRT